MSAKRLRRPDHPPETDGAPAIQRQAIVGHDGKLIRSPLVEQAEWRDPTDDTVRYDTNTRRAAGARMIRGHRRVWVIDALHESSPDEITVGHRKAALRLLRDYVVGLEGAQLGKLGAKVDNAEAEGLHPWAESLKAALRYHDAIDAIGVSAALIVNKAVLDNWSVARIAIWLGVTRDRAHGRLQAGLERLREHYWPPRQNTAAPQQGAAQEALIDAEVSDIPQERLGRVARPLGRQTAGA